VLFGLMTTRLNKILMLIRLSKRLLC